MLFSDTHRHHYQKFINPRVGWRPRHDVFILFSSGHVYSMFLSAYTPQFHSSIFSVAYHLLSYHPLAPIPLYSSSTNFVHPLYMPRSCPISFFDYYVDVPDLDLYPASCIGFPILSILSKYTMFNLSLGYYDSSFHNFFSHGPCFTSVHHC